MIVGKQQYVRSKWMNGQGQTLQLIISPYNSDFKLQQFQYRISIASLTTNNSPFSFFHNYQRWLLILQGGPVSIQNKSKKQQHELHALKGVIEFDGGDSLQSQALSAGQDFNFFLRKDKKGGLKLIHFENKANIILHDYKDFIYNCSQNAAIIKQPEIQSILNPGQLYETSAKGHITVQSQGQSTIVHCFVQPKQQQ